MMKPQTMSVKEVIEALGVSQYTVYRAVKSGKLRGFQLDRRIRVLRADVERLLQCGPGADANAAGE